ncbi:MAG TPA: amidohydrolase, partial [Pusillimonas sp.]|nr:amidohydrolase [Pusillimonas sp.]
LHNWPGMPAGTFGIVPGPIMGGSNLFRITLEGKGAHAAMPNLGHDPIMAAVQLAQSLQTTITRNLDPLDPAVLSITQIHSGTADNVIPDNAELRGTVRTLSEEALDLLERRMAEITDLTAQAFNCKSNFEFARKYPPTINHAKEAELCAEVARAIVGPENVDQTIRPSMGAEDFAFMLKAKPGCYVWLGNGDGDHRSKGHGLGPCTLHNGSYDFNDNLLPIGASYWVELAKRWLAKT